MSELDPVDPLCFVDTNIWLYAFINGPDTVKSNRARQLIRERERSVAVSSQVINEICVNLLKKTQMTEAEVRELVRAFYQKYPVRAFTARRTEFVPYRPKTVEIYIAFPQNLHKISTHLCYY